MKTHSPRRVLVVLGTRPEAIKLAPLVHELRRRTSEFTPAVCVTGQHRGLLDRALEVFNIIPEHDLDVMTPNQTLARLTSRILERIDPLLESLRPDFIAVQGDTTTTLAASLAGFYRRIPVGHVEAGLRTHDLSEPFPEELNRVLTTRLAALHFAPTSRSAAHLAAENVPSGSVIITGNTGIDALLWVAGRLKQGLIAGYDGPLPDRKRLVLVTAHRRESFGEGFERISDAILAIAHRPDTGVVYPVHPNPNVRSVVERRLAGVEGIQLIEPLDYVPFVSLMSRADILLTDSGGIQEEGPSLGKPVLVMRDKTERQEAVEAGTAVLVGTDPERITREVFLLLDDAKTYEERTHIHNPFGDGRSSLLIADAINSFLNT